MNRRRRSRTTTTLAFLSYWSSPHAIACRCLRAPEPSTDYIPGRLFASRRCGKGCIRNARYEESHRAHMGSAGPSEPTPKLTHRAAGRINSCAQQGQGIPHADRRFVQLPRRRWMLVGAEGTSPATCALPVCVHPTLASHTDRVACLGHSHCNQPRRRGE